MILGCMSRGWQRDPLSVRYDRAADGAVTRAIGLNGGWFYTWVPSPAGDPVDDAGMTRHERAFERACYYHRRIYLWGGGSAAARDRAAGADKDAARWKNPDRTHALRFEWTRQRGALGRRARMRVHAIGEASVYASRHRGYGVSAGL